MQIDAATLLSNPAGDDRAEIYAVPGGWGLAVADGAGGLSGGVKAAQSLVEAVRDGLHALRGSAEVAALLQRVDQRLAEGSVGETTAGRPMACSEPRDALHGERNRWLLAGIRTPTGAGPAR
jgi:hypothetical protein